MSEPKYTYDEECGRLAEHFLIDQPASATYSRDVFDLAQHIQDAVEMWFADREVPGPSDENIPNVPIVIDGEQP